MRKVIYENKYRKIDEINNKMRKFNISPSKAQTFGIKIAKMVFYVLQMKY